MRRSNPQLDEEIAHLRRNKRSAAQVSQRALTMTFKQRGVQSAQRKSAGKIEALVQPMLARAFAP